MHNHDVIFDLENKRIGLAVADCAASNFNTDGKKDNIIDNKPIPTPVDHTEDCEQLVSYYFTLICLVSVSFTIIIIILLIGLNKLRRGESFLWLRLPSDNSIYIYFIILR